MKLLKGFTLEKHDPSFLTELIQESGARYAAITTKQHDGVAMYNTRMNNLGIVKASPAKSEIGWHH